MPQTKLRLFQRSQSFLLFGGAALVTCMIVAACALGIQSLLEDYLDDEQQNFLLAHAQVVHEISLSESSFRNGVLNAELLWREATTADPELTTRFYAQQLNALIKPYPSQALGIPKALRSRAEVARYLSFSVQLSRICAASSLNRGKTIEGYHYSADGDLLVLVPSAGDVLNAVPDPAQRSVLFDAMQVPFGDAAPADPMRPQVRWLPPFTNPISGEQRIRLVAQAFDGMRRISVLVTEYPPEMLLARLDPAHFNGTFVVTAPGHVRVAMVSNSANGESIARRVLTAELPSAQRPGDGMSYHDGILLFQRRLGDTSWTLDYALGTADMLGALAPSALLLLGITVAIIAVIWVLVINLHRRVFIPIFAQSARVFESEALNRTLVDIAPIGLALVSATSGKMMLHSSALAEIAASAALDVQALAARMVELCSPMSANSTPMRSDMTLLRPDGDALHLSVKVLAARYQGDDVLVAAVADITARRRLVQELSSAVDAASSANTAKSAFFAAMSHEMRTPLNVILGNLELLEQSLQGAERDRLHTIARSSQGLLALINDILDFSKAEAGAMQLDVQPLSIVDVVERELATFMPMVRRKGLKLYFGVGISLHQTVQGDALRLAQVLRNLLGNAIKFTERGIVSVQLTAANSAALGPHIVLDVEDTGIGIAAHDQHKLFKLFSQVDGSITRRYGGTGLGLALSRRLVEAMRGTITVMSKLGVGSSFRVRLPLGPGGTFVQDRRRFSGSSVLVIGADRAWRDAILPHLRAWGLSPLVYDRLKKASESPPPHVAAVVHAEGAAQGDNLASLNLPVGCATILCCADGPLQPRGNTDFLVVASYSLSGLATALERVAGTLPHRSTTPPPPA